MSGSSDHDMVGYTPVSKVPPTPSRSIRRRSYKHFNTEDFLADLSLVDWTEVYASHDVDSATYLFTEKFKLVLNRHAPWIIFQVRRNFRPWLTEKTKELITQRDMWKANAR